MQVGFEGVHRAPPVAEVEAGHGGGGAAGRIHADDRGTDFAVGGERCVGVCRIIVGVDLLEDVRERYQALGRAGGRARARKLDAGRRTEIARRAATARWVRTRFGASRFVDLALPGGDLVDEGLADLASGRTSAASLLVSLAAPRLRREGVPVTNTQPDPELQLYRLLSSIAGDLGYARYNAHLRLIVSFADACSVVRLANAIQKTRT